MTELKDDRNGEADDGESIGVKDVPATFDGSWWEGVEEAPYGVVDCQEPPPAAGG